MSFDIQISVQPDYLLLLCRGDYSLAEHKRVCREVVDGALAHHKAKVLIDVFGVTGEPTSLERFEGSRYLAEQVWERALGRISQIALVGQEPLIDPQRFGMVVANNRGINAKVFTVPAEAFAWLDVPPPPPPQPPP